MRAWFACTGSELLALTPEAVANSLAASQMSRRLSSEPAQLRAWQDQVRLLQDCVQHCGGQAWTVGLEFDLLRLEKRIDTVLLTESAILVLEFKIGAQAISNADRAQVSDYAEDLRDFHAGSRHHPIQPILVATACASPATPQIPLPIPGVLPVAEANAATLPGLLATLRDALPGPTLDGRAWLAAPYQPVPSIIEAAATLFARNSVAEIAAARADTANLTRTTAAIEAALDAAAAEGARVVVFVTGIPGAGKTLCGLNVVFGDRRRVGSAFLTGNSPLVAVLREALACNRAGIDLARGPSADPERRRLAPRLHKARHEAEAALQNVHRFLADNAGRDAPPAERVIVFDEAQRAWDAAQATRDTQRRVSTLRMSEPAHALEIMGRHDGFAAIVALIGNGQEINTGEAGLREWGAVIAAAPGWRAVAAPRVLEGNEPAQRLAEAQADWLRLDPALDLTVSLRSVRSEAAAGWVDAVLRGAVAEARAAAASAPEGLPFLLTRSLEDARQALRSLTPGLRRAGFVRSSGARRLRAEGFDAQLVGTEEPVAWFLERWPDIRASDALEVAATEYACQGLELDTVGLAWGGDFRRVAGQWQARRFAGAGWQVVRSPAEAEFTRNTYRVLLTRARYETVIWVPRGSQREDPFHDPTRDAAEMDAIADFLTDCGARTLPAPAPAARDTAPALLL
ncbi:DNA/RNA helicase domain-containing protein [Falsiroseomonas sp. E2-1-a4]|uniref:DNA/RNA helicase domain-containing protein n=1 Tax=Falsiroseomonas sp. E2-1-a4 TaxID=3239299 RepID=UPI003F3F7F02